MDVFFRSVSYTTITFNNKKKNDYSQSKTRITDIQFN